MQTLPFDLTLEILSYLPPERTIPTISQDFHRATESLGWQQVATIKNVFVKHRKPRALVLPFQYFHTEEVYAGLVEGEPLLLDSLPSSISQLTLIHGPQITLDDIQHLVIPGHVTSFQAFLSSGFSFVLHEYIQDLTIRAEIASCLLTLPSNSRLRRLIIKPPVMGGTPVLKTHLPVSLEELDIGSMLWDSDSQNILPLVRKFTMHLVRGQTTTLGFHFPALEHLTLQHTTDTTSLILLPKTVKRLVVDSVCDSFPEELEDLVIRCCNRWSVLDLDAQCPRSLRSLDIQVARFFRSVKWWPLNLEILKLQMTSNTFTTLNARLPVHLRVFEFTGNLKLTSVFKQFPETLVTLKLQLRGFMGFFPCMLPESLRRLDLDFSAFQPTTYPFFLPAYLPKGLREIRISGDPEARYLKEAFRKVKSLPSGLKLIESHHLAQARVPLARGLRRSDGFHRSQLPPCFRAVLDHPQRWPSLVVLGV